MTNMKCLNSVYFVAALFLTAACGGGDEKSVVEKPKYDCECDALVNEKGGKFRMSSTKKMMKESKPYTGTCAVLSKDRDAIVTFLAEYSQGYPVKKQKWRLFNGEKIQIWDLTFDSKNLKSGYTILLKERSLDLDSSTNKRHKVLHTTSYREFNKGKQVLNYNFSDGGTYDNGFENVLISTYKGEVISGSKEFSSLGDECWNKLPMVDAVSSDIFSGDEVTVKVKNHFLWDKYSKKDPAAKKYLECLQSKEIKKFIVKDAFIDESATVGEVEADISDEEE